MHHIPYPAVFNLTNRWTPHASACALTVGNFDGVHLGHAEIIGRLLAVAQQQDLPAVVFTFDPHPATIVRPHAAPIQLTTSARRTELLAALGVDAVLVQPTEKHLIELEAGAFYADILRVRLQAAALVEGFDFRFGANRSGDIHLLQLLCNADGLQLEKVAPVMVDGLPVSSSRIRALIGAGHVGEARQMLAAPYRLTGTVVEGAKRGGPIGFPTANLAAIPTVLPAHGVYAAYAAVVDQQSSRQRSMWPAAVHIGPNISFGEAAITVEVHLIGFSGNLYDKNIDVDFLQRLRDTQKFASVGQLQAQLAIDVSQAAQVAVAAKCF